ncbi:hypothetical protein HDA32_000051 [Spinactinospora alkalitolerans]|uniref:Cell wall-active antibiotics response LiaF-like C-terminal domain-containing protein n=1 Tax=Spinactinospora alkalitolerans TaxID=687207 RepID=A0A852TNC9_9ACTN|nr:DUF1707 domain-containing protein [Spinactinospora alkalitolerans]NYE44931.1 hypothetical protein [Spinactinospora alkalitolerans]
MTRIVNQDPLPQAGAMRASDADRDLVARRLSDALAEGRLTREEHEERLDSAYRAKTIGELAPLTRDLPGADRPVPSAPADGSGSSASDLELIASGVGSENIVAVFGAAERKGRWLVEPRTNVSAMFGGVELDLREAILSQREVTVQCALVFGCLDLVVPPGVRVVNEASGIFGGVSLKHADASLPPEAPTVRVTGVCVFGGVEAKTREVGAEK